MYNLNGYELNLNMKILEKYSKLIGEDIGGFALNNYLIRLGKIKTESTSFEEAINKIGLNKLSELITEALEEELSIFFVGEE